MSLNVRSNDELSGFGGLDHARSDSLGMSLIVCTLTPGQCTRMFIFRYDSTILQNSDFWRCCFNLSEDGVF